MCIYNPIFVRNPQVGEPVARLSGFLKDIIYLCKNIHLLINAHNIITYISSVKLEVWEHVFLTLPLSGLSVLSAVAP